MIFMGKLEWKRTHGSLEYEWDDTITMDLIQCGCDLTGSAKRPVAGSCEHSIEGAGFNK
jgi:hypothetical protein